MDINALRETVLVLAFAAFLGVVWWAYGPSRRGTFERVGASVLQDDDQAAALPAESRGTGEGAE